MGCNVFATWALLPILALVWLVIEAILGIEFLPQVDGESSSQLCQTSNPANQPLQASEYSEEASESHFQFFSVNDQKDQ